MANVKEKTIRKEFQMRQRADLVSLYRTLCEKERAVVDAADSGRAGRVAILKKRTTELLQRCDK